MNKRVKYQTKNRAYTSGRKIAVKGAVLHSYGCPQPDPNVLVKKWDDASVSACVHAHIGKDETIVTLPCEENTGKAARGWHAGSGSKGSANNTHLSAEMTEPATIKYVGGSNWIELGDGSNTKAHVLATYKNAVEHLWSKFGLTMAQFRRDVKAAMQGGGVDFGEDVTVTDTSGQQVNPLDGTVTVIYNGEDGLNLRKAPAYTAAVAEVAKAGDKHTVTGISTDEKWYRLGSGLYVSAVPAYVSFKATEAQKESTSGTGYYRVRASWDKPDSQIGAFKARENAVELCRQNSGYRVYDPDGEEIYPCTGAPALPMLVSVRIDDLRIRKGPGTTYDYHKKTGKPVYTGKGQFTIVKLSDGPGAKQWGLLKSYQDKEDGWISLDEQYVDLKG